MIIVNNQIGQIMVLAGHLFYTGPGLGSSPVERVLVDNLDDLVRFCNAAEFTDEELDLALKALENPEKSVHRHVVGPEYLRWEVDHFAHAMESRLREYDDEKGSDGWKHDDPRALLERLREETEEVATALANGAEATGIMVEVADVANFAMMIHDNVDRRRRGMPG